MTTIPTVLNIIGGVAYVLAMTFIGYAFAVSRNISRHQKEQYNMLRELLALQMEESIKANIEILCSLQGKLQIMVRNEDYEVADKLNKAIKEHQEGIMKQIDVLNKRFGDLVEVKKINIGNTKQSEE